MLKNLGRYEIEDPLGSGAYADVYKALDTALERTVALKVLKPALMADEEAFARFLKEARTLANLMHPHIAWVWDLGQADGRYFLAMRYVDGPSLDKLIAQEGCVGWKKAWAITEQVASALSFAHGRGLVHRDVKPQNIIVSPGEGAVLTDFGLVKAMEASGLSTRSGAIIGTPQYIPPEVWKGQSSGPAADQYALACVLVEMLTGQRLFDAPTPPAVMLKHFQPTDLPAQWPQETPEEISTILQKALAQEPTERYASIEDFVKAPASLSHQQARRKAMEEEARQAAEEKARREAQEHQRRQAKEMERKAEEERKRQAEELARRMRENPAQVEWVDIPAGGFLYGENKLNKDIPQPYLISKYPITNAQYKRFLDANPAHPAPRHWDSSTRIYDKGEDNHPVVNVSWNEAQAFCKWAGCRLPTEAEWEKAARGTDGHTYPWGEDWKDGKYCNSAEAKIDHTTPVNQFPEGVSPYGSWDMSGNVREWTSSPHESGGHVMRGGSRHNKAQDVRVAKRYRCIPDLGDDTFGFRCARSLEK